MLMFTKPVDLFSAAISVSRSTGTCHTLQCCSWDFILTSRSSCRLAVSHPNACSQYVVIWSPRASSRPSRNMWRFSNSRCNCVCSLVVPRSIPWVFIRFLNFFLILPQVCFSIVQDEIWTLAHSFSSADTTAEMRGYSESTSNYAELLSNLHLPLGPSSSPGCLMLPDLRSKALESFRHLRQRLGYEAALSRGVANTSWQAEAMHASVCKARGHT